MYMIKEAAELAGVTVKTLRYYDKIGLLVPCKASNGYRYYNQEDLDRLQVILFYRYLRFSLGQIKDLLSESSVETIKHFQRQLILLQEEKQHLHLLINTLQKTITSKKEGIKMAQEDKFIGFSYEDNQKYYEQAVEKYGEEVMHAAIQKQKGKEDIATSAFNEVFHRFSQHLAAGLAAKDQVNKIEAKKLFDLIKEYGFDCSLEVFSTIGLGYAENEAFRRNIDQFGAGTAQYTCEAIQEFVKSY